MNTIKHVGSVALAVRYKERLNEIAEISLVSACPYPMLLGSDYHDEVGEYVDCKSGE